MAETRWQEKVWNAKAKRITSGLIALAAAVVIRVVVFGPREMSVSPVARQDVIAEVEGTGTVTTRVLPRVGTKINGRIEKVYVDEGDIVKEGQLVATLEDTDFRDQVAMVKASLESARASATQAKLDWERAERLIRTGTITKEQYDRYERNFRTTEKAVVLEEANLRYQEFKLYETKVFTFVSGLVTKRWVDPGDAVVAGQPVVTVVDTGTIWVDANVDQRFAGKVRKGQAATVILRGRLDHPFRGYVYRIYPEADPVTEEMLVQVAFPLPAAELQLGQWAEVYIEVGTATNALVVPKSALIAIGNERFVFVADPGGKVRRVKIEPGATSPRLPVISVQGEFRPGDQVILKPTGLKGGETVHVVPAPAATPSQR